MRNKAHSQFIGSLIDSFVSFKSFADGAQGPASWEIYEQERPVKSPFFKLAASVLYFKVVPTL